MLKGAQQGRLVARSLRHIFSRSQFLYTSNLHASKSALKTFPARLQLSKCFSTVPKLASQAVAQAETSDDPPELTQFLELAEHGIINNVIVDTINNKMGIHTMTEVQRMTINECLDGSDVVAQARTGTGKTLAFLIPIVQRLLRSQPQLAQRGGRRMRRSTDSTIKALIISPTRELAEQIATEAKKVVQGTDIQVQTAVGGTQKSYHLRLLQRSGCDILVGTPGRVQDILSDQYSGVKLDNIETFVLDEADRLLDIGFKDDIENIQSYMPPRDTKERQTLMFSATIPKTVVSLVRSTMRPDFKFIRTVDPDEAPTHTNVPQKVAFLRGLENQVPAIIEIATEAINAHKRDPANNPPFKAIVYLASLNEVALAHEWLSNLGAPSLPGQSRNMFAEHPLAPCQILQMSSKLSQNQRSANSQRFREAESAILVSSDVTARGMDFPNVSHIIQIGLPKSADDYVHRLGRTGRAGKSGNGWLLLHQDERHEFRNRMYHSGIKIENDSTLQTPGLDMTKNAQLPARTAELMQMVESGIKKVPFESKARTFTSLLGVLQQQNSSRNKQSIIDMMNDLARYGWGLEKPPGINANLLQKLGFSRCRDIEIDNRNYSDNTDERRNSFQRRDARRDTRRENKFDTRDPFDQGFGGGRGKGTFSSAPRQRSSTRKNDRFSRNEPFAR